MQGQLQPTVRCMCPRGFCLRRIMPLLLPPAAGSCALAGPCCRLLAAARSRAEPTSPEPDEAEEQEQDDDAADHRERQILSEHRLHRTCPPAQLLVTGSLPGASMAGCICRQLQETGNRSGNESRVRTPAAGDPSPCWRTASTLLSACSTSASSLRHHALACVEVPSLLRLGARRVIVQCNCTASRPLPSSRQHRDGRSKLRQRPLAERRMGNSALSSRSPCSSTS